MAFVVIIQPFHFIRMLSSQSDIYIYIYIFIYCYICIHVRVSMKKVRASSKHGTCHFILLRHVYPYFFVNVTDEGGGANNII